MESRDEEVYLSLGLILHGQLKDLKKIRRLIIDFLGAEAEDDHIHQKSSKTSICLKYQTLSSIPLFIVKQRDWIIIQSLKEGRSK